MHHTRRACIGPFRALPGPEDAFGQDHRRTRTEAYLWEDKPSQGVGKIRKCCGCMQQSTCTEQSTGNILALHSYALKGSKQSKLWKWRSFEAGSHKHKIHHHTIRASTCITLTKPAETMHTRETARRAFKHDQDSQEDLLLYPWEDEPSRGNTQDTELHYVYERASKHQARTRKHSREAIQHTPQSKHPNGKIVKTTISIRTPRQEQKHKMP